MTILLLLKGTKPNSEHGHVIDIFETKEEFKTFLKSEIERLEELYEADEVKYEKKLQSIDENEKNLGVFHSLWNTYTGLCDYSRSFIVI